MASEEQKDGGVTTKHSVINSTFPVLLPKDPALFMPEAEFQEFVKKIVTNAHNPSFDALQEEVDIIDDRGTLPESTTDAGSRPKRRATSGAKNDRLQKSAFIDGLHKHAAHIRTTEDLAAENKTLTENADVTNISAGNHLVDLFYDLTENVARDKLEGLLENAWKEDALMTLKIIFNTRSIHLGKSDKHAAYKAFGWLAEKHPLTLLTSLKWLVRPVIQKKISKPDAKEGEKTESQVKIEDADDFVMIDADETDTSNTGLDKTHDVRFGVSHGYWKDILNILVFAAHNELKVTGKHKSLLNQRPDKTAAGKRKREWDPVKSKELRREKTKKQNECKKSDLKKLSLAAKWVPSFSEFHDKHTFVLSSIAEILFPNAEEICPDAGDRELYLRWAREAYRKTIGSPLRKALNIVERDITAKSDNPNIFAEDINYEKVPSLAMDRYTKLFIKKDFAGFSEYAKKVASGSANISGATLLPSTLIQKALKAGAVRTYINTRKNFNAIKASAEANVFRQVLDGQWKTLVQRVRESGIMESSIAVCDVSDSMKSPTFPDGTTPMHSSIGLSLLVAEVTAPPFGSSFITFSRSPTVVSLGGQQDTRGLIEKVTYMKNASWGYNTNFTAVFENLILPMAIKHNLKPEDMVKQVFVFSDMQFDHANGSTEHWTSAFERIKANFAAAGYEMPKLIFWNLAGHRTDKPVTMEDQSTALVSGYSQGMLKTFLEGGGFEDTEEEEEVEVQAVKGENGMEESVVKKKMDPLTLVRKAVSHAAYQMLEVVD
ncbi:hypothetical protein K504DRAFT_467424 [Pleomassaria siparia CBS 279.74]|uniref:Uncharacterized protein n=1 Tax=Pleomassaria siparia CBS 279.74 TaxID=1314801 RepID=A0A6G1K9H3_9PLEO|nr:hypothetical protein K504DRAFT_467424 [Pleomassaria siparia CBS 279.74]